MNDTSISHLCPDDTMRDAIDAMQADDAAAIRLLTDAAGRWPNDHRIRFLRGAVHAASHRYDEARVDFETSLDLAPAFLIARFMLGFLDLTHGNAPRAADSWQALDMLPEGHTLRMLKAGLLDLANDRFDTAIAQLRAGMSSNEAYPLINRYISAVIELIETPAHSEESSATGILRYSDRASSTSH
ncbi:tetratricopeptide repeat protein [Burkholderia ubonensis]|uniref:tetratricopeptide repeat protein n=1 Tax=Burkholderia ubonensis TaxID=101571 RepID=UPI0005D88FEF|nr:hypothetical protein [Burkholderia ubonensis]AJX14429.1 TPR repeat family protein [Burkholderia ubonensis MSMB22]KVP47361.1 hypothetical protein WJ89_00800 [Burkholderia ubonensis]KVQ85184.1 hypothetical protein WK06_07530 [Burkholderia ubonensis]KVR14241.1 hypothetical protein WK12_10360 [Burkholderia ubonensis]KWB76997.1 hypothetical protein WL42_03965 [Burkholderia ubonensis]